MPKTLTTKAGYQARQEAGVLTVFNVPIFCACERGEHTFDDAWIAAAVDNALTQQKEDYLPPLHIRHHEPETAMNDSVRPAGFFRIAGTSTVKIKGTKRKAIIADLIITDPSAAFDVLNTRLPYRSVEIFNVDSPAIDSLALLDHEAPFLELPMLRVAEVEEGGGPSSDPSIIDPPGAYGVASATFRSTAASAARDSVVASARHGRRAALLFKNQDIAMAKTPEELKADKDPSETTAPEERSTDGVEGETTEESSTPEQFASDGGESSEVDEEQAAATPAPTAGGMGAVVKLIEDLLAAVAAIQTPPPAEKPVEAPPEDETIAPIAAPGAEVMSKKPSTNSAAMAALAGENAALKLRMDQRDQTDKRTSDVADAMTQLEGRAIGADTRDELLAFHKAHGPEAFKPYLAAILKNTPVDIPENDPRGATFNAQHGKLPEVAMKYLDGDGGSTDKAMRAAHFCREFDSIKHTGLRSSKEDYVRRNLEREARLAEDPDASIV